MPESHILLFWEGDSGIFRHSSFAEWRKNRNDNLNVEIVDTTEYLLFSFYRQKAKKPSSRGGAGTAEEVFRAFQNVFCAVIPAKKE